MLKPAFIKSSRITRRRAVSLRAPADILAFAGCWGGGDYRRIEAKNRAALKAAEQAEIEATGEFAEPDWHEVVSPDGVRCLVTRFRDQDRCHDPVPEPLPDD